MSRSAVRPQPQGLPAGAGRVIVAVIIVLIAIPVATRLFESVEPGHVKVATLFGRPIAKTFGPGLHVPVNPLYVFHTYDIRNRTHKEAADVPSQDQLQTKIDVSAQFKINGEMAHRLLSETGSADRAIEVHLVPKLRSVLREQGKRIRRAEDFFQEETQLRLQTDLTSELREYLDPLGIILDAVLIRDITLPPSLVSQIEQKKQAEQQAERQKAELERYRTEQEQLVVAARAKREAAEQEAEQRKLLADAQAYEIERINSAIASNPAYIQIQVLEALKSISKDPAAKLYFLNGESPMPLPFMNLGEPLMGDAPASRRPAGR